MHHRRGSIFLFILGVLGVLFATALSLLASSQLARTSGLETDPDLLADQAAREGVAHAIAVIREEFDEGEGIPTRLHDRWRSHFWAIDTHDAGIGTTTYADDRPRGEEFSPEDTYEDDVHVENLLTEHYCRIASPDGTYHGREAIHAGGYLTHPGTGRWFEPGVRSADPATQPISFDPAAPTGHTPVVDQPTRYDSQLRATTVPSEVRYRLRYAIAVEDLGGHLLNALQDGYVVTVDRADRGEYPDWSDHFGAHEVDEGLAERYGPAFAEMVRHRGGHHQWGEAAFRGFGYQPDNAPVGVRDIRQAWVLADVGPGGVLRGHVAGPDGMLGQVEEITEDGVEVAYQLMGPPPSFEAFALQGSENRLGRAYLYTPFQRTSTPHADPSRFYHARTDVPWRINVPTAPQQVVLTMLYAYLPAEFKTARYTSSTTWDWDTVSEDWINPVTAAISERGTNQTIDIFDQMSDLADFEDRGGIGGAADPYPGSDTSTLGADWQRNLGQNVMTNRMLARSESAALGSSEPWAIPIFQSVVVSEDRSAGGQRVMWSVPGAGTEFTASGGFEYDQSYWLDLAAAFVHTMALAHYAWQDRIDGAWTGDPLRGVPSWPASLPAGYFPASDAAEYSPDTACLDRDVDGDGVPDVVSALDTVAELDKQFIRNLGENPEPMLNADRLLATPGTALKVTPPDEIHTTDLDKRPPEIQAVALGGTTIAGSGLSAEQKGLMELILNDMRMSFFGASPQYPDFRPIDFDADGTVRCSAYDGGHKPADTDTGYGPQVDKHFSLTGCFVFQKSRYYRIFVRGELFDDVRGVPVAQSDREVVYAVDPDGDRWDLDDQSLGGGSRLRDSHVLYQRRLHNAYRGFRSHAAD